MIRHQATETERVRETEAERRRPDTRQRVAAGLRKAGDEWMDRYGTGAAGCDLTLGLHRRVQRLFLLPEGKPQPPLSIAIPVMKQSDTDVHRCSTGEPRILSSAKL